MSSVHGEDGEPRWHRASGESGGVWYEGVMRVWELFPPGTQDGRQGGTGWVDVPLALCGENEHFTSQQFIAASCCHCLCLVTSQLREVTLSRSCFCSVSLGGYPGRSESLPAQLVSKRKYIPSDTQLSPKVTAIFKAHSGHLLFEAHHAGTFLYQYSNSYPCLLVKFFCPLLYLRWKLCIICVHTLISFWTKAILRKFSTQDLL